MAVAAAAVAAKHTADAAKHTADAAVCNFATASAVGRNAAAIVAPEEISLVAAAVEFPVLLLLTAAAVMPTTVYIIPASAAVTTSTPPASPSLTSPRPGASGQGMAVPSIRLLFGLRDIDNGLLQFSQGISNPEHKSFVDKVQSG